MFFCLCAVLPRRTILFRSFAHPLGLPCLFGIVPYETLVAIGEPVISIDRMRLCIIRQKHNSPPHSSHSIGFLGGLGSVRRTGAPLFGIDDMEQVASEIVFGRGGGIFGWGCGTFAGRGGKIVEFGFLFH